MAEVGFPGQHTTTTTVTSSTTVQTNIRFDPSYVKTAPGILKVVQVVCSLLGFICIQFSRLNNAGKGSYFSWVSMVAFWFTGILLGLYLFHMVEKFYRIPWLKIEFVFCALWTVLYLLASILAATVSDDPHAAACFFGFAATLAYAVDAFLKWRAVRAGGLAQGSRVVSKQTTSAVTTPREGYYISRTSCGARRGAGASASGACAGRSSASSAAACALAPAPRLAPHDVREILARRTDFKMEEIKRLKL